jgi:predicted metal-dependent peptidase
MGPDLRDAIEAMPGLGGVALWGKFLDSDDPELIACTDGVHVEAGPLYEKYDDAERRFIVLHELLHVALAHPARGREMERRTEGFDAQLYNISCDAIINAALDGVRGVHITDGAVTLGELLSPIGYWTKDDSPSEVAAVLERTEPLLRLIVCDAGVHQIQDFSGREGAKLLRGFKFKGGGGTDFRPAIAEAAKWKPDLLIYLTDLEGYAGDEPSFPVIWAVPEGKAEAPWGKIVELS